jgi:hypothetical protein
MARMTDGTVVAKCCGMAAVLCLIFLPLLFGSIFMVASMGGTLSVGVVLGGATFVLLAGGLIVGAMRLSSGWEAEDHE